MASNAENASIWWRHTYYVWKYDSWYSKSTMIWKGWGLVNDWFCDIWYRYRMNQIVPHDGSILDSGSALMAWWTMFCRTIFVCCLLAYIYQFMLFINESIHHLSRTWICIYCRNVLCTPRTLSWLFQLTLLVLDFSAGTKTFIHVFMSFLHVCMAQVVEIQTKTYLFYIVNNMGADILATQGARAATTIAFTMLNCINSVPAH